uniref:PAS domain S-box protein n=1 Tax=Roseihalotalea indica TaxID=2867963 RepID=A0AA49JJW2_9BACT|nr:PAS domain S-box protein [Tunicatimonas sp. TK19036]
MKLFPFTFVRKASLKKSSEEYASLQSQIASATEFIKEIEKGNLEARYYEEEEVSSEEEDNQLAASLINLRKQMVSVSEEEEQRRWVAETRSKFIDILRSKNNDLRALADDIICNLVRYLSANQGGLYLLNDDDTSDVHIELLACYAYERKKHISQRIEAGQGLVGQTILEKESTYLTEIPEKYLRITSGLGKSTPRYLLIVPLKLEQNVFGAIEIASFHPIKEYEIEFAEQLGESIASTIANVKNGQRNKQLLEETQQQAEEMRAQEEEVRQNMEELSATQEEMQRVSSEMSEQLKLINATIATVEFELDGHIKNANDNFLTLMGYEKAEVVGQHHKIFVQEEEKASKAYAEFWQNLASGRSQEGEFKRIAKGGKEIWIKGIYTPVLNQHGNPVKVMKFAYDITVEKAQQKEMRQQAEELKLQEEAMRQNMEELSATQEDMHRVMKEMQASEHYLNELLNVTQDTLYTLDKEGKIISYNAYFEQTMQGYGFTIEKGFDYLAIQPSKKEQESQKEIISKVFAGETMEIPLMYEVENGEVHLINTYNPIRNSDGEIIAAAVYSKDVTELMMTKKQLQKT